MSARSRLAAFLIAGLLPAPPLFADTLVNRNQQGGIVDVTLGTTTWTAANSPYIIEGQVSVGGSAVLTIEPGVTVKIYPNLGIYVSGTLNARNAAFTRAGTANWRGIYFAEGAAASASVLDGCTIASAGGNNLGYIHYEYRKTAIYIDYSAPTIRNCTINESAGHGIELYSSQATLENNSIQNIAPDAYPIVCDLPSPFPRISGTTAAGAGIRAIAVAGGAINGTNTWKNPGNGLPYYFNGEVSLGSSAQWNIEAGAVCKIGGDAVLIHGTLRTDGQAGAPVVFTSKSASPAPGDWKGMYFGIGAGGSRLNHTEISFAGKDSLGYLHYEYRKTAVYLDGCSPTFDNVLVSRSAWNGFELFSASPALSNSTLDQNGGHGLRAEAGSRPAITNVLLRQNGANGSGYHAVALDPSSIPTPSQVSFENNRLQAVRIWGGSLDSDGTWRSWATNAPYVITGDVVLGSKATLTIEPAVIVKLQNCLLWANGTIKADGGAGRISFTSWHDDSLGGASDDAAVQAVAASSDWKGIFLSNNSGQSLFRNCAFRYGGGDNLGYIHYEYRRCLIYVDASAPSILNCTFSDSAVHGLEIFEGKARVESNVFTNMGASGYPIVLDTVNTPPSFKDNACAGQGVLGVRLPSGNISGTNLWTRPGSAFPYLLTETIQVADTAIVEVEPDTVFASSGAQINVYGTLLLPGTEAQPIVFTSRAAKPAAGDWPGIYLGPSARNSRFQHVQVAYAGRDSLGYIHYDYRTAAIYFDAVSPSLEFVTVSDSAGNGFEIYNGNPTIANSAAIRCARYGLKAEVSSRPKIQGSLFENNGQAGTGTYTIGMDASSAPVVTNLTFVANRKPGVQIWGGTVGQPTRWQNWGIPYVLTSSADVKENVLLEIEKGAIVKFQDSLLWVAGALRADGEDRGIVFTSWRDDLAGGDSDGSTNAPAASQWRGIYLSPASGSSFLNACTFRYAGGDNLGYIHYDYRRAAIYLDACSPVIANCRFVESGGYGLELYSSTATIVSGVFQNGPANYASVRYDTLDCFPTLKGNAAEGTGLWGISIPGGSVGSSGTWQKPGANFPYRLSGDLTVDGNVTLTVAPGAQIKTLWGLYINGALNARGSAAEPIVFASRNSQQAPGDWKGMYFGPAAGKSILRFCQLLHTGADNLGYINYDYRRTAIYVERSAPLFSHLIIAQGAAAGLMLYNSQASLDNSLVTDCAGTGIVLYEKSAASLLNNTIVSNKNSGISCGDSSALLVNNISAFNLLNGISGSGAPILRNNCVFGNKTAYSGLQPGAGDIASDPQFANSAQGDFHLASGSPAINAGDNSVLLPFWTDLDDHLRVAGGVVDLGAYETGAALANRIVDASIRNQGASAFIGQNVFAPEIQSSTQNSSGLPAVYEAQVEFRGNVPDQVRVNAEKGDLMWYVRYFMDNAEITASVSQPGGLVLSNLAPGTTRSFRIEVIPSWKVPGDAVGAFNLTFTAEGNPDARDVVTALTRNLPRVMMDLAVRRDQDLRFEGEYIYSMSGISATRRQEVEAGMKAIYVVLAKNQGNRPDSFTLKGGAVSAGWQARAFYDASSTNDISGAVFGQGWKSPTLEIGASLQLRVEVIGNTNIPPGAALDLLLFSASQLDPEETDSVRMVTSIGPVNSVAQGGTYTRDEDFEEGVLAGVEFLSKPDQLQLGYESVTLPFIWVPNSNQGTVSKVDTRTGRELARYRTGPDNSGNPSRTTVDQRGNCWVANRRTGTVVKLGLREAGQWIDRNQNGIVETSSDKNGDGDITGDEMLAWGQDECVLVEVVLIPGSEGPFAPGTFKGTYANDDWNPGPRGVAVDASDNVWIGTHGTHHFYYLDGPSGKILRNIDATSANHTSYGAVVDAQGILWSSGQDKGVVLRLDPGTGSFTNIQIGHYVYGMGLDRSNHLFISGYSDQKLTRLNVITGTKDWTVQGFNESRGVAVTADGDVWVANTAPGTVTRWSNDGIVKAHISVGSAPTGVAVDAEGKVWVVNNGDEFIKRIDPWTDQVDLAKRIVGGTHYGYSDMTGILARTATTQLGTWTVTHNSGFAGANWGTVSWTASEPQGTSLRVNVRSSADLQTWSAWERATNGLALAATPDGKYLQVEVRFQLLSGEISPILYDLTIRPEGGVIEQPEILIARRSGRWMRISWSSPDFLLESSPRIHPAAASWSPVQMPTVTGSDGVYVDLEAFSPAQFYRLRNK